MSFLGYKPNIPTFINLEPKPICTYNDYCIKLLYRLQISWKLDKECLIVVNENTKASYDLKLNLDVLKEWNEVY